jgi:molybdopterin synthase sulfur carrier subunit
LNPEAADDSGGSERVSGENHGVTSPGSRNAAAVPSAITVEFAASLRRHVDCPPQSVAAGTLRDVLESALEAAPRLADYVFDDQRAVRKHVAVFVNDCLVPDRVRLNQPLDAGDRVLVIQALSGG